MGRLASASLSIPGAPTRRRRTHHDHRRGTRSADPPVEASATARPLSAAETLARALGTAPTSDSASTPDRPTRPRARERPEPLAFSDERIRGRVDADRPPGARTAPGADRRAGRRARARRAAGPCWPRWPSSPAASSRWTRSPTGSGTASRRPTPRPPCTPTSPGCAAACGPSTATALGAGLAPADPRPGLPAGPARRTRVDAHRFSREVAQARAAYAAR